MLREKLMDARLATLISDYQACVAEAVAVLERAGFPRPASDSDWVGIEGPEPGAQLAGYRFYKHGMGCAVHGPSWSVDFDFGGQGQIDGIDPHRLKRFAEQKLDTYGFASAQDVEQLFAEAVNRGALRFSGHILYYVAQEPDPVR
jgi:hypothetical protein